MKAIPNKVSSLTTTMIMISLRHPKQDVLGNASKLVLFYLHAEGKGAMAR